MFITKNGDILWRFSGRDIWVNLEGKNPFSIESDKIRLTDFGPNGVYGVDDSQSLPYVASNNLISQSWMSFEIPLSQQTGLNSRSQLAQIIFLGGDNSTLYVDNIYFHN